MIKPNLSDPEERAVYRRELIGLYRGWRWGPAWGWSRRDWSSC